MAETSGGDFGETAVPDGERKRAPKAARRPGVSLKNKKVVRLGRLSAEEEAGPGGMGEGPTRHADWDRKVALKVLSKELAKKPGFVAERSVREVAALMARTDHP